MNEAKLSAIRNIDHKPMIRSKKLSKSERILKGHIAGMLGRHYRFGTADELDAYYEAKHRYILITVDNIEISKN